jgi:phage baseplate assembly protein W
MNGPADTGDRTWPMDGPADDGTLTWSSGDASVRESLLNLLLTRPGERLMRPQFGAGVTRFVHELNNETTRGLLAGEVSRAAQRGEPRIALDGVDTSPDPEEPTRVTLSVRYRRLGDGGADALDIALDFGT